jgi:phage-related protein
LAILPLSAAQWDLPRSFTASPIVSSYGKSTLTARTNPGLNPVRQQWNVRAIVTATDKSTIDAFLSDLAGAAPFQFDARLKQPGSFTCKERSWNRLGVELGVVLWELSMVVEEWFVP